MPTPTAQQAAQYGITFSTGAAATPQGVANAAANGIINNVQTAPSGGSVAPAYANTGSGVATIQPAPGTAGIPPTPQLPQQPQLNPLQSPVVDQNLQTAFQNTTAAGLPPPQDSGQAAGAIAQQVQQAQQAPRFYKPDPNSSQVVNAKGEKLSYDQYIAQGGKPDFSNTQQGGPPPMAQSAPEVENFLQTNPIVQPSMQELVEFLSPASTRKELESSMSKIVADQKEMAGLKLDLMNVKRVMEGSNQDIRDEIEKAGGFGTNSQILALTIGRNQTLLKQANVITDQLNYMQDVINSDMTMYGFQKDMAQQEFQQRSFLLNYKQQNDQFVYKATQDVISRNLELLGPDGLYNATGGDPVKIDRIERAMGLASGGLKFAADQVTSTKALAKQKTELELQKTKAEIAQLPLEAELKKAQISAARASAANSAASAAKTRAETSALATDVGQGKLSDYQLQGGQQILSSVAKIIPKVTDKVTGRNAAFYERLPQFLQSQDYRDFKALLLPLKSQITSQTLTQMREASKTGGALGSVSDYEGTKLESALGALDTAQSAPQFIEQLNNISSSIVRWEQAMVGQGVTVGPDGNLYQITQ